MRPRPSHRLHCQRSGLPEANFAYKPSQTALLMRLLLALRPAFACVRVTPTFAVGRTPMYVWLGGYAGLETAAAAAAVRFLSETPVADAPVAEAGGKTGGGGGGCTWDAWHHSEWSAEVALLHTELRESLAHVWTTQADHLRKQRLEAELAFESSQQTRSGGGGGGGGGGGCHVGLPSHLHDIIEYHHISFNILGSSLCACIMMYHDVSCDIMFHDTCIT